MRDADDLLIERGARGLGTRAIRFLRSDIVIAARYELYLEARAIEPLDSD